VITVIAALLVIWLFFIVLGFVVHGLLWLAIVGVLLFIGTSIWGGIQRNSR
jgi:hypothetical protein